MAWKNNREPVVPIVQAISVGGPMASGRNQPLRMLCETENGMADYVAKLWNNPELPLGVHGLAREIYGALLANFFELNTPEVAVVEIEKDFSVGVPDPAIRERVRQSAGLNFGSKYLPDTPIFNPPASPNKFHEAALIFCFDMLIGNLDRNLRKPNLFDTAKGLILFDHEQAFPYSKPQMMLGGYPAPWDFIKESWHADHVLYSSLKGKDCALEIEEFVGILYGLSDRIFATMRRKYPPSGTLPIFLKFQPASQMLGTTQTCSREACRRF